MKAFSPEEKSIIQELECNLPSGLTYHGLHHILYVFKAAIKIGNGEQIRNDEMKLLRIAALYHDAGFMVTYKKHEAESCKMVRKNLPQYGYIQTEIEIICGIIMAQSFLKNQKQSWKKLYAMQIFIISVVRIFIK